MRILVPFLEIWHCTRVATANSLQWEKQVTIPAWFLKTHPIPLHTFIPSTRGPRIYLLTFHTPRFPFT